MNLTSSDNLRNRIDYLELIRPYSKNWKWFAFAVVLALLLAIMYIRYATPEFAIQGKIQILEDQNASSETTAFRDLEILSGGNTQVEDEIEILNSRTNFVQVVKNLGLNTKVTAVGNVIDSEQYLNPSLKISFLMPDSLFYKANGTFALEILSATSFLLTEIVDGNEMPSKEYKFGNTIPSSIGNIEISPNVSDMAGIIGREYEISVRPVDFVAQQYQQKMLISITNEISSIVSISLNDQVPQKAIDIINTLVDVYNQNGIDNKRAIANRTSAFIDDRIAEISGELSSVDEATEEYKSSRGITDVSSQSNVNLNLGAASRQQLQSAQIQLDIALAMKRDIDNMAGFEVLPTNIGDGSIASAVAQFNDLVLQRNTMLRSSNERNPIVVNLDQQLLGLKQSLQSSLARLINNMTLEVNNLSGQLSRINSQIYTAPEKERALRVIGRQQETIEALYLYLLQKREESQITFANSSPKSKIIDRAYLTSPNPVSPKIPIILLASLILGFAAPFSVIYAKQLLDNKVHNKIGLEKLIGALPVLGELPKLGSKDKTLVKTADRSVLAESMRIVRTNLDYLIKSSKRTTSGGAMIFVTSSVPGEGKTFVSSNLAMIYAKANKKVLLVGGDIRNPKINEFYSGKNVDKLKRVSGNKEDKGLTDYLIDDTLTARDITNTMLVTDQTIDIIHSGKLIPNPAELLMNDRLEELVSEIRKDYDYIIVDTAPMVVVSDTMLMTKFADVVVYVTRADVTNKKVLEFPLKMNVEGKLNNLTFVINGVKDSNLGYGGKYGYGYGKSTKKWWQFT